MFEFKYFMLFVMFIELMMTYFLISAVYNGYKQKRVKFKSVIWCSIVMIVILLITLAITVFI